MKRLKHIISCAIWTLAALYAALIVLVHIPQVQGAVGAAVASALAQKLGTQVSVGRVDLGFLNRVIIDDVNVLDQRGERMLRMARLSAKIDLLPLREGKISVSSVQLFGLKARLYKENAHAPLNAQFVIDSLASKSDTASHTPLHLHIGSIIIRHGDIAYDQRDASATRGVFSPRHIGISRLSAHLILDRLTDDDIHLMVKKLSFVDKSGLQVDRLSFRLDADKRKARLSDFRLELPHSQLALEDLRATYRTDQKGKMISGSLRYEGGVRPSRLDMRDMACLLPALGKWGDALRIEAHLSGNQQSASVSKLRLETQSGHIRLRAKAAVSDWQMPRWTVALEDLSVSAEGVGQVAGMLGSAQQLPKEVERLGDIHCRANVSGKAQRIETVSPRGVSRYKTDWIASLHGSGSINTEAGSLELKVDKKAGLLSATADTKGIQLGKILDNDKLGSIEAHVEASGTKDDLVARGNVGKFDFNQYSFRNIGFDGSYRHGLVAGQASIDDPNARLTLKGSYSIPEKQYDLCLALAHLQPSILGVKTADKTCSLSDIQACASNAGHTSHLDLEAPFATLHMEGQYDYATLGKSITNMIASKLPTLPGIGKVSDEAKNDFSLKAEVTSAETLRRLLGVPLDLQQPATLEATLSDSQRQIDLQAQLPAFSYKGSPYSGGAVLLHTQGDTLALQANIKMGETEASAPTIMASATAHDNNLTAALDYDNHSTKLPINGKLNAEAQFYKTEEGVTTAHVAVMPSLIHIGGKPWSVDPADITYSKNRLLVDHFSVSHANQHITIDGLATATREDSIVARLEDVDVEYILNLVNFHSVDFAGKISGQAVVKDLFGSPDAYAKLDIRDFEFEQGPLGVLHAGVSYDRQLSQIDISAVADDGPDHQTIIEGYVSPQRNYIDLGITAQGSNLKFMESFCGSFMNHIEAWGDGHLNLVGDLGSINLVGDLDARGKIHMKQLGTDYTFNKIHAHAVPDDILISNDTIYDRDRHFALVSGGIHHKHLTKLSYDIDLQARNFLGYDTHEFGENTFYGTVYATGKVGIHGKSGETVIDIDAEPGPGSLFVYNAASPDAIGDKSFIHWHSIAPQLTDSIQADIAASSPAKKDDIDFASDMRIDFLIKATPNLTTKLIMDPQSGDYITLNGNGVLSATWYNKGSFDMFGNYVVDHGQYKLTIQNVIKKDFEFQPGGTIAFGGNPYSAPLHLQAKYTVNGVPLSDLSIGRSFSSNNIRVDCLMNITGTPQQPSVDFTMDMPTVNADAKQMIYSVINSQEEMNQQVLYLLGIGRFYAQGKNNQASEDAAQQSQTSLAMQSFLSGTISQQINTVLSNVVKSNNWNFGANISTGDEGFYNAEYEGTLSGSLLNNRLLFNGQFGYRDNANTTQNFIGDFDLRYLIFPNGNLAVRMYNQSNDRYFTRNSLNTQGLGLIMKKDFNGWRDLFGIKKKQQGNQEKKKK